MDNTYIQLLKKTSFEKRKNINITVGLSGGVDSAVTAYLLKKDGFNVKGVFMMCFDDGTPNCRSHLDKSDAIRVAASLSLPIEIWNFEKEYKKKVTDYFVSTYKKGLTPNPDILCNSEIKFKLFLNKAIQQGADYVATGHYAKIVKNPKSNIEDPKNENRELFQLTDYYLAIPKDKSKDQTYFLSDVSKDTFQNILFPLGDYLKSEIREIAKNVKIPVADKKDSTGICFLEGIKMQDFLRNNIKEKVGNVVYSRGKVIGKHIGVWFYTIGQRHGFEVNKYTGVPLYVIKKDPKTNTLVVGEKKDLYVKEVKVMELQFEVAKTETKNNKPNEEIKDLYLRIRNLGKLFEIEKIKDNTLFLKNKIDAVAPGQYAVVYQKVNTYYKVIGAFVII